MLIGFVIRRLVLSVFLLFLVSVVVFSLTHLSGDPARLILGTESTPEQLADLRTELGLDQPLLVQYWNFLWGALHGDLGNSLYYHEDAVSLVLGRLPATLQLSTAGMAIALAVALPAGMISALRPSSFVDYASRVATALGQGLPAYWIGIMLIILLSVRLGWFPAGGYGTISHLVLPAITLGMWPMARMSRVFRSSVIEVLQQDYVTTAVSKGMPPFHLLTVHVLRNALIPVTSVAGLTFGVLLGGTVVTEFVFSWPGMGRLALDAVNQRDFPIVQAVVLFTSCVFIVINLLVDIATAWLDPRIQLS